jgi:hypothetical protein
MDEVVLYPGMTWEPDLHMGFTGRVRADDTGLKKVQARVAELEAIRARAVEWFRDTDLTHPSVSEAAIHDAMAAVLGEGED